MTYRLVPQEPNKRSSHDNEMIVKLDPNEIIRTKAVDIAQAGRIAYYLLSGKHLFTTNSYVIACLCVHVCVCVCVCVCLFVCVW